MIQSIMNDSKKNKKRKKANDFGDEESWFLTIIPLETDKFYLGFRQEEGLGPYINVQWYNEHVLDSLKGVVSIRCNSEHEAFWMCYQKTVEYISSYGIQNVRSDVFPEPELCGSVLSHIDGLLKHKVISNFTEITCNRCLKQGHSGEVCFSESNTKGEIIDESFESSNSSSSDLFK